MLYNLFENRDFVSVFAVALLAEGVDRNIRCRFVGCAGDVALLAEGVDRNCLLVNGLVESQQSPSSRRAWIEIRRLFHLCRFLLVALLAEGVDRNYFMNRTTRCMPVSPSSRRAWIEIDYYTGALPEPQSPSSRRAWIEISKNFTDSSKKRSPSSRRAWIEIFPIRLLPVLLVVALLAEGVDRNFLIQHK